MTAFVSETLADQHLLDQFLCGRDALDIWLQRHARHAQSMRTGQAFVWHTGDRIMVAYFSLAAHLVVRTELPTRLAAAHQIPFRQCCWPLLLSIGLCKAKASVANCY